MYTAGFLKYIWEPFFKVICFDWVGCLPDRSSPAINLTVGLSDRPDYQLKLSATWDCYWCLAFKKKKEWETILLGEKSRRWSNLSIVETLSSPVALSGQTNIYSLTEQTHPFTLALFWCSGIVDGLTLMKSKLSSQFDLKASLLRELCINHLQVKLLRTVLHNEADNKN